ncbi:MAG: hypothetical protein Q8R76_05625 [Candidatus Omnitrophota bacterium]|nr:hypothetical protein [Candidatus Omnitrophota bacterium]
MILRRTYLVGVEVKHRIDFVINPWLLQLTLTCDGDRLLRRSLLLKTDRSFEFGTDARHLLAVYFNIWDAFRQQEILDMRLNGHKIYPIMLSAPRHEKIEGAIDEAACALLFVAVINVAYSVKGFLFSRATPPFEESFFLIFGGMVYLLLGVRVLRRKWQALALATLLYAADSFYRMASDFSVPGLVVRIVLLYFLVAGFAAFRGKKSVPAAS